MTNKEEDALTNCIVVMKAISICADKDLASEALYCFAEIMNVYMANIEDCVCPSIK